MMQNNENNVKVNRVPPELSSVLCGNVSRNYSRRNLVSTWRR
jgi:hypothetical protein